MTRPKPKYGRADRVREFFADKGDRAFTAREIRDSTEPGGNTNCVSATLSTLVAANELMRVPHGNGVKFRNARTRTPRATTAQKAVAQVVRAAPPAPAADKPLRQPRTRVPDAKPTSRPACSLEGIPLIKRASSERIAADIARFQRQGGKIEQLGPTQFFTARADNDPFLTARARGRATQASNHRIDALDEQEPEDD